MVQTTVSSCLISGSVNLQTHDQDTLRTYARMTGIDQSFAKARPGVRTNLQQYDQCWSRTCKRTTRIGRAFAKVRPGLLTDFQTRDQD